MGDAHNPYRMNHDPVLLRKRKPVNLSLDGEIVAAARDDASAAIIVLCPGHGGGLPTIEGETIIPGVLPGQSAWIPVSWIAEHRRRAA